MGYVGVSSINLIFTHCMGHCRSSFNPIKFIHSWLLIQFLDNMALFVTKVQEGVLVHL